jgi:hypothetical protein
MNRARILFALVAVVIGAACAGDSTGNGGGPAGRGTLIVRLTTPHSDDGAILFELSGPRIDSVVAVNASLQSFTRRANDSTIVGAVIGVVVNGAVVTLQVPDVNASALYAARIVEVADRDNVLRASLTGYALTVSR